MLSTDLVLLEQTPAPVEILLQEKQLLLQLYGDVIHVLGARGFGLLLEHVTFISK